jgi:hypothetical protein
MSAQPACVLTCFCACWRVLPYVQPHGHSGAAAALPPPPPPHHSTAHHTSAQHSTAQHSTAQHSTARRQPGLAHRRGSCVRANAATPSAHPVHTTHLCGQQAQGPRHARNSSAVPAVGGSPEAVLRGAVEAHDRVAAVAATAAVARLLWWRSVVVVAVVHEQQREGVLPTRCQQSNPHTCCMHCCALTRFMRPQARPPASVP